jgi:hypothetical protein
MKKFKFIIALLVYSITLASFANNWHISNGKIPVGALRVGTGTKLVPLYLCRGYYKNTLQPGKTWKKHNKCNISFKGKEVKLKEYEVYIMSGKHGKKANLPKRECVTDSFGNKYCGYNCVVGTSKAVCAKKPDEHCVIDDFGNSYCGYSCLKTESGNAKCATSYGDNCIANSFGDIQCGKNCHLDSFGQVECG